MSQAFESYHLRTTNIAEAVSMLKAAGLRGFVFPSQNGWVSFCPEGLPFAQNDNLIARNVGTMIQVACSEDFGWTFIVFLKQQIAFLYDSPGPDYSGTSPIEAEDAELMSLLSSISAIDKIKLHKLLFETPFTGKSITNAYLFCEYLGLPAFRDISYEVLESKRLDGLLDLSIFYVS